MCLLKYILVPFLKLFVRETIGFDSIPKQGPVILVANHSSYIDGVLIRLFTQWYCSRTPKGIMAHDYYYANWFMQFVFGVIFPQIPTNGSVERALEALQNDEILMLFPEGGRTHTGKMQKATHTGLGVLAATGAPVIPIGIQGSFDWWSRHRLLPTFKLNAISVRVGKQLHFVGKQTKQNYLDFQRKAMKAIAKIAHTKYPY